MIWGVFLVPSALAQVVLSPSSGIGVFDVNINSANASGCIAVYTNEPNAIAFGQSVANGYTRRIWYGTGALTWGQGGSGSQATIPFSLVNFDMHSFPAYFSQGVNYPTSGVYNIVVSFRANSSNCLLLDPFSATFESTFTYTWDLDIPEDVGFLSPSAVTPAFGLALSDIGGMLLNAVTSVIGILIALLALGFAVRYLYKQVIGGRSLNPIEIQALKDTRRAIETHKKIMDAFK